MKRLLGGIGVAWLMALVAFAILATGTFHPHHRLVAVSLYAGSWIPFLFAFRNKRRWLRKHATTARGFVREYGWYTAYCLFVILFLYVFLLLVPLEPSSIAHLRDSDLSLEIAQDAETLLYLDSLMLETLRTLEEQTAEPMTGQTIPLEERTALGDSWQRFLDASFEIDLVKQRYKTFAQVNGFTRPTLHAEAFLLAYGAFLAQYTHALSLQSFADENAALVTLLNEESTERGIPPGTYFALKQRMTHPNDLLRLNAGRAYLELMRGRLPGKRDLLERIDQFLAHIDDSLDEYPALVVENPLEQIEQLAFDTWFPLQKRVALNLSYIRTANRDYLITPSMLATCREQLQPGDVLLQRREWHATNVGIPGYWTHAALYIGTTDEMDAYFSDIPDLESGVTAAEYLQKHLPQAYASLQDRDPRGYRYSIIEAKRPGVVFTSLEESAGADSLAVLRPRVSKSDRFHAVLASFSYLGKPYDYNFDFRTDSALVCSELIYKAYEDVAGLTLTPTELNGRPMLAPNSIGRKFDDELGTDRQQLDLVLFLDGNEVEGTAVKRGEEVFRTSWQRPKWHILRDYAPTF